MCELSNWTGKAYKIPRKYVKSSNDRPELANTGIYFLFGKSDDKDTYRVYIGEAENIYERLNTHLKEEAIPRTNNLFYILFFKRLNRAKKHRKSENSSLD